MSVTQPCQIAVTAEVAAIAAIRDYETMAKADHQYMPEYWIVCRIASDLAKQGFAVECEKRIEDIVDRKELDGRIDLAVYSAANQSENRLLRALIEVKGPRTTWPSFPMDFLRLKSVAEEVVKDLSVPDILIGLLYAPPPMAANELNEEQEKMICMLASEAKLRVSDRQQLQGGYKHRTPQVNDLWEIMSIFDQIAV